MYHYIRKVYTDLIQEWEDDKINLKRINITDRKKHIAKLQEVDQVVLMRDPDNGFDKNAIKLLGLDHNQLGFIAKQWAAIYSDKMDVGIKYKAVVTEKRMNVLNVELRRENLDEICFLSISLHGK